MPGFSFLVSWLSVVSVLVKVWAHSSCGPAGRQWKGCNLPAPHGRLTSRNSSNLEGGTYSFVVAGQLLRREGTPSYVVVICGVSRQGYTIRTLVRRVRIDVPGRAKIRHTKIWPRRHQGQEVRPAYIEVLADGLELVARVSTTRVVVRACTHPTWVPA